MNRAQRQPSAGERSGERAFLITMVADSVIVVMLVLSAVASGSLTMLGEATRSVLLTLGVFFNFWLLRAVNRNRLPALQFGTGKIEQFAWLISGLSLVIGAGWVGHSVFTTLTGGGAPANPLALAIATLINAVNLAINLLGWTGMRAAATGGTNGVLGAEIRSRFIALIVSLILQVTLTMAALAKDPALVMLFDAMGALIVTVVMLKLGLDMANSGISSLFDQPATPDELRIVRRAIEASLPADALAGVRTRRGGDRLFVEIAVHPAAIPTLGQIERLASALRDLIANDGVPVDLCVVPDGLRS